MFFKQIVKGSFMVEVLFEEYKNPLNTLANTDCCSGKGMSFCRQECSNNIWLCVSRKNTGRRTCDLANVKINEDHVGDNEEFYEDEDRFKNPFTTPLPADFKDVSCRLVTL